MRKFNTIILTIILFIAIFACSQGYIVNTTARTDYPEGRNLFMSKCGGCHQLFDPNSHTEDEWNKIMLAMQQKSKINDQQKIEIISWILETKKAEELMINVKNNY